MALEWNAVQTRISTLITELDSQQYDVNPPHQRNIVHPTDWKEELITSIFEPPCAIPETWWHPRIQEDGREITESVDGKQRISTIYEFAKGRFTWRGTSFDSLSQQQKNTFLGHRLSMRVASRTLNEAELSRIFKKLQQTKRTTLGEVLNAELGPFREKMRALLESHGDMVTDMFRNRNRHQDLEAYAKAFDYWYRKESNPTTQPTRCGESNDVIETWNTVSSQSPDYTLTTFGQHLASTWKVFLDNNNIAIPRKMNATTWLPVFCILCDFPDEKSEIIGFLQGNLYKIVANEVLWPKVGGNHDCVLSRKHALIQQYRA